MFDPITVAPVVPAAPPVDDDDADKNCTIGPPAAPDNPLIS